MNGRVVGAGELRPDRRLLPPPSGEPFRLPDQRVDLATVLVDLRTPPAR